MKVYFFGSISGGTQDIVKWYRPLIKHIKKQAEVLSEDIFFHDKITDGIEPGFSDLDIFKRDVKLINEADILIGDVTVASHGVGWEIRHAQGLKKPILCLHRVGTHKMLSPMLAGNPSLSLRHYTNLKEAKEHIDMFFSWLNKRKKKQSSWLSFFR